MTSVLEQHREQLTALCRKYRVKRLEVFGSATGESFDPSRSDIDLLVEFLPIEPGAYFDTYFNLLDALQQLLGAPVHLVVARAIRNPYSQSSVNESTLLLHAARRACRSFN
ncbi:MAG: nucleotidyltransferase domain-containing protein [Nitrospinae bacterium]|nr:nucleotidyltransferase domain-containing protein [Nitrospinota bacterium]